MNKSGNNSKVEPTTSIEKNITDSSISNLEDNINSNNKNNNNNNNNKNQEKPMITKLGGANEMPRSFDAINEKLTPRFKKKLRKIVSNKNLSDDTKNELIVDLFLQLNKQKELQQLQKLPSANESLLGAGKDKAHSSGLSKTNEHRAKALGSKKPKDSRENETRNCDGDDSNDGVDSDNDDDDSENHNGPVEQSDGNENDNHDYDGDDDSDDEDDNDGENDVDDDDVDDDNDEDNENDDEDSSSGNDERITLSKAKVTLNTVPDKVATGFLLKCKNSKIPISTTSKRVLHSLATRIGQYLSNRVKEGWESSDRRFLLTNDAFIHYTHHITVAKMSLQKLYASLLLGTTKLFRYLESASKKGAVKKYTFAEKTLISNLVRLAKIRPKFIGCAKIRRLCRP